MLVGSMFSIFAILVITYSDDAVERNWVKSLSNLKRNPALFLPKHWLSFNLYPSAQVWQLSAVNEQVKHFELHAVQSYDTAATTGSELEEIASWV